MKRLAIPSKIVLPFGFVVPVVQLPLSEFVEAAYEAGITDDICAFWSGETIYLNKARPIKKRRADLSHEVIHAVADWQAWVLGGKSADPKE